MSQDSTLTIVRHSYAIGTGNPALTQLSPLSTPQITVPSGSSRAPGVGFPRPQLTWSEGAPSVLWESRSKNYPMSIFPVCPNLKGGKRFKSNCFFLDEGVSLGSTRSLRGHPESRSASRRKQPAQRTEVRDFQKSLRANAATARDTACLFLGSKERLPFFCVVAYKFLPRGQ